MSRDRLHSELARMEDALAATRSNLRLAEQVLSRKAEAETIRRRPKARHYHRRMCRWTGADEAEYRLVLANLLVTCGHDLDCLRRKIMRQDEAILAFRRKYGVNADRRGPDG